MHSCINELTFRELSEKEVICISDGARLGYITDLEIDAVSGCIKAFLLPENKFFSFASKPGIRISTEWVEKIGEDIILVSRYQQLSDCGGKKSKRKC